MNERIKELCEQVGIKWRVNWRHQDAISGTMTLKQFEKFAELIVKECADFVAAGEFGDSGTAKELKEHFGVEE